MTGPVFIVGSGRSGTTILRSALHDVLKLPGDGEGHLYPVIEDINDAVSLYYEKYSGRGRVEGHMLNRVAEPDMLDHVARMTRNLYVDSYGADVFIDKTPGPHGIRVLPHMEAAFPGMCSIYAKRRGIEVVRSAVKKFPHADFASHCRQWSQCIMGWHETRATLSTPYIEIDQKHLESDPQGQCRRIGLLLGLDAAAVDALANYMSERRPQSSGSLNAGPVSLETAGWTLEQIDTFRRECRVAMALEGYSEDESYFRSALAAA